MKSQWLSLLTICGAAATALADKRPYSVLMTEATMARKVAKVRWYTEQVFYRGVQYVYNATGDAKYAAYIRGQLDPILTENGTFTNWDGVASYEGLDNLRVGETMLFLWEHTGQQRYLNTADFLRREIDRQNRTDEGGLWHMDKTPDQQWLDGLWMVGAFYAHWTALFEPGNGTAWDDIAHEFDLIEEHCRDPGTGLLFHGYDESRRAVWADPVTGASPMLWDRADGWYFNALLDVLDWFPRSHPGFGRLRGYFVTLAEALRRAWDGEGGGWWLVMGPDYVGRKGNYIESSGTALFVTGFLKGMRKGYIPKHEYQEFAFGAYDAMTRKFVNETCGTINWEGTVKVGHLNGNGTFEAGLTGSLQAYIKEPIAQNWLLGVGPFIYASSEIEAMRG
ncbi:uncharacterized protein E0L32_003810 [Thyridium curvatum]|uniref:Uncharacterized protein n=1 Tax=Thyridium curvatum TaxID=1093900 RepID=A0A507BBA6_9PEZI|nr:uncharacterized protein E0L32_003810 [Thyridium curvatum]TPX16516.1 hypothetical protein E0L32_003810 [Thyridium curvatum]